ncbi:hypothetical protein N9D34_00450 [Salibacteraceae bacterium]|nr:hypothetical protein [Salibacteraceae bacterium]
MHTSGLAYYLITPTAFAADSNKTKKVQFNLNDDGSHYIRLMGLGQYWLRYTDMNPGSMIYNTPVNQYTDMGIRRLRFHLLAQINDYVLFYAQFGLNNFGFNSQQFQGAFFHDALGEIKVIDDKLSIGGGLTAWSGLSRYSTLGVGSIMSLVLLYTSTQQRVFMTSLYAGLPFTEKDKLQNWTIE